MTLRCEDLRICVLGYTPFDRMPRSWQEIGKVPLDLIEDHVLAGNVPYDTSTTASTMACSRWSNMSDWLSSVLKSAEPANTRPETVGRSFAMKNCVADSATCNSKTQPWETRC